MAEDAEAERIAQRRLRHARETLDALDLIFRERSAENLAAFHELHARHLHELGDEEGAERAQERADRARRSLPPDWGWLETRDVPQ